MRHTEAILRFLDSLGRVSDAQFYLGLFHSLPRESFAVLSVDGEVVRDALEALVFDLRYLSQLELYPSLVFGLLDDRKAAGHTEATVRALARAQVPAVLIDPQADLAAAIRAAVQQGTLPVLALDPGTGLEARFEAIARVLEELRTRKLILVRRHGRLGRRREDRISIVNLSTDYERLLQNNLLPKDQVAILAQVRHLLCERLHHRALAAVTSPLNLLKELFTVKGGGTLIKRGGTIRRFEGTGEIDRERLHQLLESSFGKRLRPGFLDQIFARVYLEDSYRGAALVRDTPMGAYLSKFAVETQAQGEGLGRDLWELLAADYPALFWRARPDNRILPFYEKVCDGLTRFPRWHVFWTGIPPGRVARVIQYALDAEEDFLVEPATPEAPQPAVPIASPRDPGS
jgi:acetylglutamate kinase